MRFLGIDYGRVRLGLALSDEDGVIAHPLPVLRRAGSPADLEAIRELVVDRAIERIIVGCPRNMDGSTGEMAEEVMAFVARLEQAVSVPVDTFDERLTSVEADRVLREARAPRRKRRTLRDGLAAVLILQGYLDASRRVGRDESAPPTE